MKNNKVSIKTLIYLSIAFAASILALIAGYLSMDIDNLELINKGAHQLYGDATSDAARALSTGLLFSTNLIEVSLLIISFTGIAVVIITGVLLLSAMKKEFMTAKDLSLVKETKLNINKNVIWTSIFAALASIAFIMLFVAVGAVNSHEITKDIVAAGGAKEVSLVMPAVLYAFIMTALIANFVLLFFNDQGKKPFADTTLKSIGAMFTLND